MGYNRFKLNKIVSIYLHLHLVSKMVYFRKRIGSEIIDKINEEIVLEELKKKEEIEEKESKEEIKNQGKIILDASCTPADIAFP